MAQEKAHYACRTLAQIKYSLSTVETRSVQSQSENLLYFSNPVEDHKGVSSVIFRGSWQLMRQVGVKLKKRKIKQCIKSCSQVYK